MIGLAALATAGESSSPGPERILQAQRNQRLVDKLVDGGLNLARETDRIKRAEYCNNLAKSLADEIKQAADDHDGDRVVELGRHLQELLKNGVAANLGKERRQVVAGSAREKDLARVKDESDGLTGLLMIHLAEVMKDNPDPLNQILELIQGAKSSFLESDPNQ
jgi:hypothetical protein